MKEIKITFDETETGCHLQCDDLLIYCGQYPSKYEALKGLIETIPEAYKSWQEGFQLENTEAIPYYHKFTDLLEIKYPELIE